MCSRDRVAASEIHHHRNNHAGLISLQQHRKAVYCGSMSISLLLRLHCDMTLGVNTVGELFGRQFPKNTNQKAKRFIDPC